jgi:hypothetical protein
MCSLLLLLWRSAHSISQIRLVANNPLCDAGFKTMESHFETDFFPQFHHISLLFFPTRPSTMANTTLASSSKWAKRNGDAWRGGKALVLCSEQSFIHEPYSVTRARGTIQRLEDHTHIHIKRNRDFAHAKNSWRILWHDAWRPEQLSLRRPLPGND